MTKTFDYRIPAELERTEAIRQSTPTQVSPLREVAQSLTRRGVMAAKAELANQALFAIVDVLFDEDADYTLANIDQDGRILIAKPWGRLGYKTWGLRATEAKALNYILRQRSDTEPQPLFVYDATIRDWLVGRGYGRRMAMSYLRTTPVTLSEWRAAWRAVRSTWAAKHLDNE